MTKPSASQNPKAVAANLRQMLKDGGSSHHAAGVQWFFKDEIQSHGWYTAALRKAARQTRKKILEEYDLAFLVKLADQLFTGSNLEEKVFAVFLLERLTDKLGDADFKLFESWLDRISSWADHDALLHDLVAPMVVAKPTRKANVFRWAKSKNRWHRRAACVALIRGTRLRLFFPDIKRLSNSLLKDENDMVQKGLGWLLRETAKADAERTVPYLISIRGKAPRLVLRTACETLTPTARKIILQKS